MKTSKTKLERKFLPRRKESTLPKDKIKTLYRGILKVGARWVNFQKVN